MKRDLFTAPGVYILRQWDRWNGASFIAWRPHVSVICSDRKALLRFIAWPTKTPTGDRIREWLDGFEQEPAEPPPDQPATLSAEVIATGFGPECHLDDGDPNYQTRTII